MQQETKKPVEIIQELIAIHTTRIEAAGKLMNKDIAPELAATALQSDQFVTELMNELSNYGDAEQSVAERENRYQQIWKDTLGKIEELNPQESGIIFTRLEESLKNIYSQIITSNNSLPDCLQQLFVKQNEMISG